MMRLRRHIPSLVFLVCLLPAVWSQPTGTDMQRLLSRLQSMGHGYYPASEWNTIIEEIDGVISDAEAAGDTKKMVDVTVILAEVFSGMLGQHSRALATVNDLKQHLETMPVASAEPGMAKLYVKLAEMYSRVGDPAAIQRLVDEFKSGPFYDPEDYGVTGLNDADDPARIRRPYGKGEDSITVSSMNRYLRIAGLAPGNTFPSFSGVSIDNRPVRIPSARGQAVLVDFWVPNWVTWQRNLPAQAALYKRYHERGFEIVGFNLASTSPDEITAFAAANGMDWLQVAGERKLASRCGVAGEAANFLIDGSGRILARDIHGGDLAAALRSLFGE